MSLVLISTALAACSAGSSLQTTTSHSLTPATAQSALVATGTLTVRVAHGTTSVVRKPAYISTATTQAALFVDTITTAAGSSSSCSSGCTIPYTTTAGTHTFRAEIASTANVVLAAGSQTVAVLPGAGNNLTMTLDGAAAIASWVANSTIAVNTISGTYSIEDPAAVLITSAPAGASGAFDNAPIAFAANTSAPFSGTASFTTTGSSTTLSAPTANGNNYPFTATCGAGAVGNFSIGATAAPSAAGITAAQLSGLVPALSYPPSSLNVAAMHDYACDNGLIIDASEPRFVYTANNTSGTISAFSMNPATGVLTAVPGSPYSLPSVFDVASSGPFLYACGIVGGGVFAYTINPSTGALTAIAGSPFAPADGAQQWVTTTPNGSFLYTQDGAGTAVYAFTINPATGALTAVAGSPYAMGTGGGRYLVATNGFLYATSNPDGIFAWSINASTGALTAVPGSPFAAGTQAYALGISPNGSFLYTAGNVNGVYAYTIDASTGALTAVAGSPFAGPSSSTPNEVIAINPASSFLYVSSATSNVYGYSINGATGVLSALAGSPFTAGGQTWGVAVDPTGLFLDVANATGASASAFTINPASGVLTAVPGSPFATGNRPIGLAIGTGYL